MSAFSPDPFVCPMRKTPRLALPLVATTFVAVLLIAAFGAQAQSAAEGGAMSFPPPALLETTSAAPAESAGTARRLQLAFATRTVALNLASDARTAATSATVSFPRNGSAMTERTRAGLDALRSAVLRDAPGQQAFAILVSGDNATLAQGRAQALRAEWIARRQFAAHNLVAAARVAGQAGRADDGSVRVDVVPLDAMHCGDCGQTGLRAIALDSAAAKLVIARLDGDAEPLPREATQTTTALPPTLNRTERKAAAERAEPAKRADRLASPIRRAGADDRRVAGANARCPKPRIIIDDYWPGGPLVPCHGRYR